jgi:drug/metabolite transporter (DMT)-like permease
MALARTTAAAAGLVYCAEPVVAALSSTFILAEPLSAIQLVGGALVMVAIVLNVLRESRRRPEALVPLD